MKKQTAKRTGKFIIIGATLAVFNFLIYTLLARLVFKNNDLLWIDTMISYVLATILAYFLHSNITWKERDPGKTGVIKFFAWNFLTALVISPFLTWLFGFLTPLYEFAHNIFSALHIPFDYDFVESTGIFCLATFVTMILNYFFYDKLVFGPEKPEKTEETKVLTRPENSAKKVSIIVPIYNTEKYLKKCIDSITSQTHENLEIILGDDGSTDKTPQILDTYAKKDKRIKVFHQKNQGQSAARNFGLQKAAGDFISFIDSDDKIKPDFIEKLLNAYDEKTALSICGIHYKRLRQNSAEDVYITPLRKKRKTESKKAYILYMLATDGRLYSSVNKLYRADVAKTLKFDETLNFAEDTKFVLDYLKKSKNEKINFVLEPLYIYNFGTETSTMSSVSVNWKNWQTSYKNLKTWLGKNPTIKEALLLHLVHLRWHISYLRAKRRAKTKVR